MSWKMAKAHSQTRYEVQLHHINPHYENVVKTTPPCCYNKQRTSWLISCPTDNRSVFMPPEQIFNGDTN